MRPQVLLALCKCHDGFLCRSSLWDSQTSVSTKGMKNKNKYGLGKQGYCVTLPLLLSIGLGGKGRGLRVQGCQKIKHFTVKTSSHPSVCVLKASWRKWLGFFSEKQSLLPLSKFKYKQVPKVVVAPKPCS